MPVFATCRAQPRKLPAMLVHCFRRGKRTSPFSSVSRSSSCEDSSRLYCCHSSRTVIPGSGLWALSNVVTVHSGATICGKGMRILASNTAAPTRIILIRVDRSTLQILALIIRRPKDVPAKSCFRELRQNGSSMEGYPLTFDKTVMHSLVECRGEDGSYRFVARNA